MRKFLIALGFGFLFPLNSFAVTNAYKPGDASTDDVTELKSASAQPSADTNYMTFEIPVGTDYQVTAGKTFYITKISGYGAASPCSFDLGYGDTGVASGAAAPTNAVISMQRFVLPTANNFYTFNVWIPIPATKYPFIHGFGGQIFVQIFGIEK